MNRSHDSPLSKRKAALCGGARRRAAGSKRPRSLGLDAHRVTGKIAHGDLLEFHDFNFVFVRSRQARLLDDLLLGLGQRCIARIFFVRKYAVNLRADRRDGYSDGIGHVEVLGAADLGRSFDFVREQDAAAADQHNWHRSGAQLERVDAFLDHQLDLAVDLWRHLDRGFRQLLRIAELHATDGYSSVSSCESLTAENQSFCLQFVADTVRTDTNASFLAANQAAAA